MAWLLREDDVLARVEVADRFTARLRGLLGRDGVDGALVLPRTRSVHTLGMRFAIGVAHCAGDLDGTLRVVAVRERMPPWRLGRPVRGARVVIEAEVPEFARWGLRPGDELRVERRDRGADRV